MAKRPFHGRGKMKSSLPFSPAVAFGSLLFVSGQVGKDETGQLAGGGFEGQVRQVMENIGAILEPAGCTFDDVLKVTVYLADFAQFSAFNEVYKEYFSGVYPARTTIQAGRLGPGVEIEIDAIAGLAAPIE